MIPLQKLLKLPRSQRLRKTVKILGEAEHRFAAAGQLPNEEAKYLADVLELLAQDENFSPGAAAMLNSAGKLFTGAEEKEIRRALTSARTLLLAETGRFESDWDFLEPEGALDPSKRRPFPGMQVYLEDIRSPYNVGAIFRAAESFGAEKLMLSPFCADPLHKRAERTAMGCVHILPWERLTHDPFSLPDFTGQYEIDPSLQSFITDPVFALETGGTDLENFKFPQSGTLIVGSEELGVSPRALDAADASLGRVSIRTWGVKGSLNVSVAFGIVMQAWAIKLASL